MTLVDKVVAVTTRIGQVVKQRSVPPGGLSGQVLKKTSPTDFATQWADAALSTGSASVTVENASGPQAWAWAVDQQCLELKLTGAASLSNPVITGIAAGKTGTLMVSGAFPFTFGTNYRGNPAPTYTGVPTLYTFVADSVGRINLAYTTTTNPYNDPAWLSTVFLLGTNGINNATNNTFVDSSANNLTFTKVGNLRQGKFSPFSGGVGGSVSGIGAANNYISSPSNVISALPGQLTAHAWLYPKTHSGNIFYAFVTNGFQFTYKSATEWGVAAHGNIWLLTTTTLPTLNAWNLISVTRDASNVMRLFLNGVVVASGTIAHAFPQGEVRVGDYLNGNMANVILKKGVCEYTASFTPPTATFTSDANTSFLLNFANAGIFDNTTKRVIETQGAAKVSTTQTLFSEATVQFSGTGGDCLVMPASQDWNVGAGNFTLEFSANRLGAGQDGLGNRLFQTSPTDVVTGINFFEGVSGNGLGIALASNGSTWDVISNQNVVAMGTGWHHYALVRSGNTFTFYRDNVVVLTFTSAAALYYNNTQVVIGGQPGGRAFNGAIANFRFTKGVARTITLPTAPFAIA